MPDTWPAPRERMDELERDYKNATGGCIHRFIGELVEEAFGEYDRELARLRDREHRAWDLLDQAMRVLRPRTVTPTMAVDLHNLPKRGPHGYV